MVRTPFIAIALLCLTVPSLHAGSWDPVPLVIDCPPEVAYRFDGSALEIPFTTSGKPAMIWLVVNTNLPDDQKPVAVRNGFMGWHFVNGIDTTVYVSAGREFAPGEHVFAWDGRGNEKQYENLADSGAVGAGTYSYYLYGYDNKSNREVASDFIPVAEFGQPPYTKFYTAADRTGAPLDRPLMMGGFKYRPQTLGMLTNGAFFKFRLGDDPYDSTLIDITTVPGFETGDIVANKRQSTGTSVFDPHDYGTFYFVKNRFWDHTSTVVKYQFVSGGEAIQDTTWGDFDRVTWWWLGNNNSYSNQSNLAAGGDLLYMSDSGQNYHTPMEAPADLVRAFPRDNPADVRFEVKLDEFWAPDPPEDTSRIQRKSGEANHFAPGPEPGQFYLSGESSCLTELVDCQRMLSGARDPFAANGSGYVVWANSNGDFFVDKNAQIEPMNPIQLWACQTYEPRTFNTMRASVSPADRNGIMLDFLDFANGFECAAFTSDGTGIGYLSFADTYHWGGSVQKYGYGTTLDTGGRFDGLYMLAAMSYEPYWDDKQYKKTCWIAADSDGGIITPATVVTDAAPVPFTLSPNTPNPFNPATTISFTLAQDGPANLSVFNIAGQKVATLADGGMSAGGHAATWDASGFPAGVYFYTLTARNFSKTMKMTLVK